MKKMQSGLFCSMLLVIMFAFLTGVSYSQSDSTKTPKMNKQTMTSRITKYDKDVMDAASKLKTQINLTAEQTRKVEGILQNYKLSNSSSASGNNMSSGENSNMSSSNNSTLNKIEKVLTADQKTKFDQIKDQWWSETQSSLSKSSTTKKSLNTDKPKSDY